MEQFFAFQSIPTTGPVLAFNTFAPSHLLHEKARSGTALLETLTAKADSQNLHHLVTAALVSLQSQASQLPQRFAVLVNAAPTPKPALLTQPPTTHPLNCFKS
ncbi:hypothetical protein LVW35_00715 [Pseudomonas sp. HN11]|uniref:hypothetical protein n=1 Tax=Pseudomonas sp. HN11 TaxID=1344094 RepID=UPI001F357F32|nr:hypothetical protein [Pseudomonas sp. HN11]UII71730.1 hypothetical protein LVW35_00715 [Pseudomonas sp. HN11]